MGEQMWNGRVLGSGFIHLLRFEKGRREGLDWLRCRIGLCRHLNMAGGVVVISSLNFCFAWSSVSLKYCSGLPKTANMRSSD